MQQSLMDPTPLPFSPQPLLLYDEVNGVFSKERGEWQEQSMFIQFYPNVVRDSLAISKAVTAAQLKGLKRRLKERMWRAHGKSVNISLAILSEIKLM